MGMAKVIARNRLVTHNNNKYNTQEACQTTTLHQNPRPGSEKQPRFSDGLCNKNMPLFVTYSTGAMRTSIDR